MIMRTTFISAALIILAVSTVEAQKPKPLLEVGQKIASVGLVIGGNTDGVGIGGSVEYGQVKFGDVGVIGVGVLAAYQSESRRSFGEQVTVSALPIMFTTNAHFGLAGQPKIGLYGGASMGIVRYSVSHSSAFDTDLFGFGASGTQLGVGVQGGLRFAVSPTAMVHGQLALGDLPLFTAGMSFKF